MTLLTTFLLAQLASASSPQKPLGNSHQNCLPGPISDKALPSCITPSSSSSTSSPGGNDNHIDLSNYHPWTHRRYCPEDAPPYCIHTSSFFRTHGLSFVTIPHSTALSQNEKSSVRFAEVVLAAEALSRQKQKKSDGLTAFDKLATEPENKPWAVKDLPGKGKGVIATETIPKGTVLMVEHAAVIADSLFPSRVKRAVGREMLSRAIERLGEAGKRAVMELATSGGGGGMGEGGEGEKGEKVVEAEDVMKTNSFTVDVNGKSHMALFPRVARVNHACQPSAITKFDENTLSMTVRTIRDLEVGDEITLSYSDFGLTYPTRQRILKAKWGFDCSCSLCSASPSEIAASDARREKIAELGKAVIEHVNMMEWKNAIKTHREMMDIIEDEGLAPHMGDYYEVMTRLLAANKDLKKAKKYAKLAIEEFKLVGERNEELEGFVRAA